MHTYVYKREYILWLVAGFHISFIQPFIHTFIHTTVRDLSLALPVINLVLDNATLNTTQTLETSNILYNLSVADDDMCGCWLRLAVILFIVDSSSLPLFHIISGRHVYKGITSTSYLSVQFGELLETIWRVSYLFHTSVRYFDLKKIKFLFCDLKEIKSKLLQIHYLCAFFGDS